MNRLKRYWFEIVVGASSAFVVCIIAPDAYSFVRQRVAEDQERTEALACIHATISNVLECPATAQFPSDDDVRLKKDEDGTFVLESWLDAHNGFGALVRNHYRCGVRRLKAYSMGEKELISENWFIEAPQVLARQDALGPDWRLRYLRFNGELVHSEANLAKLLESMSERGSARD